MTNAGALPPPAPATPAPPRLSIVTPSCRRPIALRLAHRWMASQTTTPYEWIIADRSSLPPGSANFHANLIDGVSRATGDWIVFWEDDDYYAPNHLAALTDLILANPTATLVGDDTQRYYHLPTRRWRIMHNRGASLCQTAMHVASHAATFPTLLANLARVARHQPAGKPTRAYSVDAELWNPVLADGAGHALALLDTVVGIKGIPGQRGLGMGHQPERVATWAPDPQLRMLRLWVGAPAAALYTSDLSSLPPIPVDYAGVANGVT